jgi:hypothetical protein
MLQKRALDARRCHSVVTQGQKFIRFSGGIHSRNTGHLRRQTSYALVRAHGLVLVSDPKAATEIAGRECHPRKVCWWEGDFATAM